MNIWRDNYYLESDYDSKTKLSIIFSFAYKNLGVRVKIVLEISDLMSNLRPSTHAITFPPARYLIGALGLRHICHALYSYMPVAIV